METAEVGRNYMELRGGLWIIRPRSAVHNDISRSEPRMNGSEFSLISKFLSSYLRS